MEAVEFKQFKMEKPKPGKLKCLNNCDLKSLIHQEKKLNGNQVKNIKNRVQI